MVPSISLRDSLRQNDCVIIAYFRVAFKDEMAFDIDTCTVLMALEMASSTGQFLCLKP